MKKNLVNKSLTEMQKNFAQQYVEASVGSKHLTNTEVAIQVGYSPESAYQRAHELLNPKICPHVVKYIGKMREDFLKKNDIDPNKIQFVGTGVWDNEAFFSEPSLQGSIFPGVTLNKRRKFIYDYYSNYNKKPTRTITIPYDLVGILEYIINNKL